MKDMEILKEKDIPYFEELEKEGKAVIIRLNVQKLLEMDPNALFAYESELSMPTDEQVIKWLEENNAIISKYVDGLGLKSADDEEAPVNPENLKKEAEDRDIGIEQLLDAVKNTRLNEEDKDIIMDALKNNFRYTDILSLLDENIGTAQRSIMYQVYKSRYKEDT